MYIRHTCMRAYNMFTDIIIVGTNVSVNDERIIYYSLCIMHVKNAFTFFVFLYSQNCSTKTLITWYYIMGVSNFLIPALEGLYQFIYDIKYISNLNRNNRRVARAVF